MLQKEAEYIFSFFEAKGFPTLATKIDSCEHPDLSYHVNRMLTNYNQYKTLFVFTGIPEACMELYDLMVRLTIFFHDLGKLNCFFQYKMLGIRHKKKKVRIEKSWSYHTGLSSLFAFFFLSLIKKEIENTVDDEEDDLKFLVSNFRTIILNAIICHHFGLSRVEYKNEFKDFVLCKEYFIDIVFYFYKYIASVSKDFMGEINKNELNQGLKSINCTKNLIEFDLYEKLEEFFSNFSDSFSARKKKRKRFLDTIYCQINGYNRSLKYVLNASKRNNILFQYVVYLSSVLTNLDKWEAKTTRSSLEILRDIKFTNIHTTTLVPKPNECIKKYKEQKKEKTNLDRFREDFATLIAKKKDPSALRAIYTITAPCGIGKTLAVLDFAFDLRDKFYKENKYYPKIIYALPFISICDQMEDILQNLFGKKSQTNFLSVHHTLAEVEKSHDGDQEENVGQNTSYLSSYEIRNWYSEIIVTTTVKLFNTMLKYQKIHLPRFHRLTNSIIIIDEYHSIPKKYHDIIRIFLKVFSEVYNTTFILMTATTPGLFIKGDKVIELTDLKEGFTSYKVQSKLFAPINRYKIRFYYKKFTQEMFEDYCKLVIEKNLDKSIMIVVNTRSSARNIYRFISSLKSVKDKDEGGSRPIFHLSGNMIPLHRNSVLKRIRCLLKDKANAILVTTQLIEAGIDISFQKVIRDLGPFYSIVQVAGRCNRNWEIRDDDRLPTIDIINIEGSHKYVYDDYDIEQTVNYFENYRRNKTDEFVEISEKKVREEFHNYSKGLNIVKKRDYCLDEFKNLDFQGLTNKFQLIKKFPKIPIIVIPDKTMYKEKEEERAVVYVKSILDKMRRNELKYFPTKLYRFVVEVYEKQEKIIEKVSFLWHERRHQKGKNVFEKFCTRNILFYVLDMENSEAKLYYSKKVGLELPE